MASTLYWKALPLRGEGAPHLPCFGAWLDAFERRPAYIATKSDYYTHVNALPSQNGPGYLVSGASAVAAQIDGLDGAWDLPAARASVSGAVDATCRLEPLAPLEVEGGETVARHAAAFALAADHESVVRFASRGASEPGVPGFAAELADPNAEPNDEMCAAVDVALRHVTAALIDGAAEARTASLLADLGENGRSPRGEDGTLLLATDWEGPFTDAPGGREYFWNDGSEPRTAEPAAGPCRSLPLRRALMAPTSLLRPSVTGEATNTAPTRGLDACLAYMRDRVGVPRDMGAAAAIMLRSHLQWARQVLLQEPCPQPPEPAAARAAAPGTRIDGARATSEG